MEQKVSEFIKQYKSLRQKLAVDKSHVNYKEMIDAYYLVVVNWGLLQNLEEFSNLFQDYEEIVLRYLKEFPSIRSIFHVSFYYSDNRIIDCIPLEKRKKHLLKGLKYIKSYHELLDQDVSACQCIRQYLQLYEACRTGEDLEQGKYSLQAYQLAKEYAIKYRTEKILEDFKLAKMYLVMHYRMHEQEIEAEKVEQEYGKIVKERVNLS